jgi:hypothetical protein
MHHIPSISPGYADNSGMWKRFFALLLGIVQYSIPYEWAEFFTTLLMSPTHFGKAKDLMQSTDLLSSLGEGGDSFSLPSSCPSNSP